MRRIAAFKLISEAIDVPAIEGKRDAIMTVQAALDDAQNAAEDTGRAHSGIRTAAEEATRQELIIRQASAVINEVDVALPLATARLEEARRGLDLSEAAGSEHAEYLRLKLLDGQPCPVCGATEHPVTAVALLLKESRSRRPKARGRVGGGGVGFAGRPHPCGHPDRRGQRCARGDHQASVGSRAGVADGAGYVARLHCYSAAVPVTPLAWSLPPFAEDAATTETIETIRQFRERVETVLRETKESIARASDAEAEARKLTSERDSIRTGIVTARDEIQKLKDEAHAKAGEAATLRGRLQGMDQNLAAVCGRLDMALAAVFPDWRQAVSNLGAGFAEVCRGLVEEWRACREELRPRVLRSLAWRPTWKGNEPRSRLPRQPAWKPRHD